MLLSGKEESDYILHWFLPRSGTNAFASFLEKKKMIDPTEYYY
jgi:hypothetical protein